MSKIRAALVLILLSTTPANAAIDEAGAQRLKNSLQKMLDYQKAVNEAFAFGETQVIYEGALSVVPQAEYYTVELPSISIVGKNPESEEGETSTLTIGKITMNAIPADNAGEWKMTAKMPQKFDLDNGAVTINIGAHNIAGLYNENLGYFTKTNLNLGDMSFNVDGEASTFKLGGLKLITNFDSDSNGLYTGPGVLSFQNIALNDAENGGEMKIGDLRVDFSITNMKMPTIDQSLAKLEKNAADIKSLQQAAESGQTIDSAKVVEMLYDFYGTDFDGYTLGYSINDVYIKDANTEEAPGVYSLKDASFKISGDKVNSDEGVFGLAFGYSGLTIKSADELYSKVAPKDVKFNIKASKIPMKAVSALADNTLKGVAKNPEMAEMAGLAAAMKLPMILAQAGSKLNIADTHVRGDGYKATIDGEFTADMSAVMNVTGKLNGLFSGLDALLQTIGTAEDYAGVADFLGQLKASGNAAKDAGGQDAYSYEFIISADGSMTLNGQDFMALMSEPSGDSMPEEYMDFDYSAE